MSNQELIEILKSKIMLNEISNDELRQIMDICEVEIVNSMAMAFTNTND